MKKYKYTVYLQDGTSKVLELRKKEMSLQEKQEIVGGYIEIVPRAYYDESQTGECNLKNGLYIMYGNEEGRFNETNKRNPFFKVLVDENGQP